MTNVFESLADDVVSEISSSVRKQLKNKVDTVVAAKLAALFHDTSNEMETKWLPEDVRKDPDLGRWHVLVKEEMGKFVSEKFFDEYVRDLIKASIRKYIDRAVDEAIGAKLDSVAGEMVAELPASTYSPIHQG